jgi:hypothetical protein
VSACAILTGCVFAAPCHHHFAANHPFAKIGVIILFFRREAAKGPQACLNWVGPNCLGTHYKAVYLEISLQKTYRSTKLYTVNTFLSMAVSTFLFGMDSANSVPGRFTHRTWPAGLVMALLDFNRWWCTRCQSWTVSLVAVQLPQNTM